jgi:IS605 OrfB family transposase
MKRPAKVQRTYHTRISDPDGTLDEVLGGYAEVYGRAERALFADLARGGDPAALKSDYLIRFGLTARQFNAIAINLKGKIASIQERREGLIEEAKARIKTAEQVIAKLDQALSPPLEAAERCRRLNKRHQKQRRLARLRARLARLEADRAEDRVRLCFGGRRRFHAQFDLTANGYDSHDQPGERTGAAPAPTSSWCWGPRTRPAAVRAVWPTISASSALPCVCGFPTDSVRRATNTFASTSGCPYGTEALVAALTLGQAISYRFQRDAQGWRVFITTQALPFERRSDRRLGAIGVDLNADHLAVCETDRHGNPIASLTIPLVTYGLDRHQTQARIGEAIKTLMDFARDRGKPLAIEKLDFSAKKAALEAEGGRYARMLSALAYDRIVATLKARAHDAGLEVLSRNPAYTSLIGREKFAERYGLGPHHAAALVIARRALNLSERPNRHAGTARPLPVRNRGRHVWAFWRQVAREQRRMHRPGGRSTDRSRAPPTPRGTARTAT